MTLMATEKQTPKTELRPDEITPNTWDVVRGEEILGQVIDEGDRGQARGRFAAWSPKSRNPRGVVGFFDSAKKAHDAIAKLWPSESAPGRRQYPASTVIFQSFEEAQRAYVGPAAGRPSAVTTHPSGIPLAYQPRTHDRYVVVRNKREENGRTKVTHLVWNRYARCTVFTHPSEKAAVNKAAKLNAEHPA